jgi:hypothetical protein
MSRRLILAALLVALLPHPPAPGRVLLISFDGLGYQRFTEDPVARELVTLRRLLETGAHAEGLMPAYPSSTANSHAALWTGTYAGRNGILYNTTPILPRSDHTFSERIVGFRSEALTAEPIWLTAARQGVPVVAHQVTQAYPFLPQTVGAGLDDLTVVNGFQTALVSPWRVVRASDQDVRRVACDGDGEATARVCVEWSLDRDGQTVLRAELGRDGMRVSVAWASAGSAVEVLRKSTETDGPQRRPLARYWSAPLAISRPGQSPAAMIFRLLELDTTRGRFTLMQSPVREAAVYDPDRGLASALVAATGPMVGNGAHELYESGGLGVQAYAGGTGSAERLYLETVEVVVRQQIAQSSWLWTERPGRLHVSYLSAADEFDHQWYGLDAGGDRRYTGFRRWGYAAVEHAARAFVGLAGAADHVVVVSDHGMTAERIAFDIPALLAGAGLEQQATALGSCLLLNTVDWKGGTIASGERAAMVGRLTRLLTGVRTAQGEQVVTRVYASAAELAAFGLDGPAGPDLCVDLRPGVGLGSAAGSGVLRARRPARGSHGLDPTRADMQAILLVRGPRVTPGASLGRQRSAVVAPLVADLLGIEKPASSTFASPLAAPAR